MAMASGCKEFFSPKAQRYKMSSCVFSLSKDDICVILNSPVVNVPVLSNAMVFKFAVASR